MCKKSRWNKWTIAIRLFLRRRKTPHPIPRYMLCSVTAPVLDSNDCMYKSENLIDCVWYSGTVLFVLGPDCVWVFKPTKPCALNTDLTRLRCWGNEGELLTVVFWSCADQMMRPGDLDRIWAFWSSIWKRSPELTEDIVLWFDQVAKR